MEKNRDNALETGIILRLIGFKVQGVRFSISGLGFGAWV